MSEYRSDEETVEVIANWWKENGAFMVGAIVLVVGGVLGWNGWQDRQLANAEDAAALYAAWERAADAEREALAAELAQTYPDSAYRALLGFETAGTAMDNGDAAAAREVLEDVLALQVPRPMQDLARIRLARVALDEGDAEAALAHLDAIVGVAELSMAEELRGDALRLLGRHDEALTAYERAVASAEMARPLLEIKQDDLLGRLAGGRL